jgi:hypothetical protein
MGTLMMSLLTLVPIVLAVAGLIFAIVDLIRQRRSRQSSQAQPALTAKTAALAAAQRRPHAAPLSARRSAMSAGPQLCEPSFAGQPHALERNHDRAHPGERRLDQMRAQNPREPEPGDVMIDSKQHTGDDQNPDRQKNSPFERHYSLPAFYEF